MKFVIESIGRVGSRARVGGHELVFDQPTSVPGGADRGPSPLDVMAVAVAGCAHYFASAYLQARGMQPDGLRVELTAEKGRVPVPRLTHLVMTVVLPPAVAERHIAGIERAIKSCPAYGTLLYPPEVQISIAAPTEASGEAYPPAAGKLTA